MVTQSMNRLCELKKEQIDLLENYILAAGIRGFARWNRTFDKVIKGFDQEQVLKMKNCKSYMIIAHVMLSVSCLVYFACRFFDKISNATHDMIVFSLDIFAC